MAANGFGGIYIGASGLQGAQNALNTTANNLANVNTKGYVRQQVVFSDNAYSMLEETSLRTNAKQSGLGATISDVVHVRDEFVDKAYRLESGRNAFYETCYETVGYVEDLLQELDGAEFKSSIKDLWTSFQELAKTPADSVTQNLVLQKSELMLSRAQTLYNDLKEYQKNIDQQIQEDVTRVNEIGQRIYEIGLEIKKVESNGKETAMTLRDERDLLLDELSTHVKADLREDNEGFIYITVGGVDFVSENGCNKMLIKSEGITGLSTPYWEHLSRPDRNQYVNVFNTDQTISSEMNTDVGSLKAKLVLRGEKFGTYSDLLTAENYQKVEDKVVIEVQAQIDLLVHEIVTAVNDAMCPNIDYQVQENLYDANGKIIYTVGQQVQILDEANCARGQDGSLPPQEIYERMGMDRYTVAYDKDGKEVYVYNPEVEGENSTLYRLGNLQVNDVLKKVITKFPAYTQNGAVDFKAAERMLKVWEGQDMHIDPSDQYPCNFQEFYDKMVSKMGTDGNVYKSSVETLNTTTLALENSRQQVLGVSSDEELTKLIRYQAAYNAASRYMNVVTQMTELLIMSMA